MYPDKLQGLEKKHKIWNKSDIDSKFTLVAEGLLSGVKTPFIPS
jgi:hypothetical protein